MKSAIDVSNYQPRDLSEYIACYSPELIIIRVKLPCEPRIDPQHEVDQANSAKEHGIAIAPYVWAYGSFPAVSTAAAVQARFDDGTFPAEATVWVDCEDSDAPNAQWLRDFLDAVPHLAVGIYTGSYWWRRYMHNTDEFAFLPLWHANYFTPYGGWELPLMHQFTSTPIDRSVVYE